MEGGGLWLVWVVVVVVGFMGGGCGCGTVMGVLGVGVGLDVGFALMEVFDSFMWSRLGVYV